MYAACKEINRFPQVTTGFNKQGKLKQERVCSLEDRLVVVFIDKMLKILVWDDFGSITLSNLLFDVEQFWLNLGKIHFLKHELGWILKS